MWKSRNFISILDYFRVILWLGWKLYIHFTPTFLKVDDISNALLTPRNPDRISWKNTHQETNPGPFPGLARAKATSPGKWSTFYQKGLTKLLSSIHYVIIIFLEKVERKTTRRTLGKEQTIIDKGVRTVLSAHSFFLGGGWLWQGWWWLCVTDELLAVMGHGDVDGGNGGNDEDNGDNGVMIETMMIVRKGWTQQDFRWKMFPL